MSLDTVAAPLAGRRTNPAGTAVRAGGVEIGGRDVVVFAGPCAVEDEDQVLSTARAVKAAGARVLRGGAYKPRTSPYSFPGLKADGLAILARARAETGLPVVTEVMDARHLAQVMTCAAIAAAVGRGIAGAGSGS